MAMRYVKQKTGIGNEIVKRKTASLQDDKNISVTPSTRELVNFKILIMNHEL
jgi:hypothetical protein